MVRTVAAEFRSPGERDWLLVEAIGKRLEFRIEAARRRVDEATDRAWELNRLEAHRFRQILTDIQLRLLPWPASVLVHAKSPVRFRVTYY